MSRQNQIGTCDLKSTAVADLRGAREGRPLGSKFFQFHAVFGKFWPNPMLPPGGLASPPRGNTGSATALHNHVRPSL